MKPLAITAIIITMFSTYLTAQQLPTGNILSPNNTLTLGTENLLQPIEKKPVLPPFALSKLPNIGSVVTKPLATLPTSLPIQAITGENLWLDVEVENGWRAIKEQWLILADQESKKTLIKHGANIIVETRYAALGLALLRFNVPSSLDSKQALSNILPSNALTSLARNHIYQAQNKPAIAVKDTMTSEKKKSAMCNLKVNIGLVDSAIDTQHEALQYADITAKSFLPTNLNVSLQHGTAIASLLVGQSSQLNPLLPKGKIYSAQVFYQQSDFAQGATLSAIISGLNWLIEQDVNVINMSLAGPENQMLHRILTAATAKGAIVVAAGGNEGPAAPAMYPAAYSNVIAVSAIDKKQQAYRWSNRGDYIDYSALGVNVLTAQNGQRIGRESGTSIAAPHVSAAIACLAQHYGDDKAALLNKLNELAIDLGPKGKDPVFGIGAILSLND